MSAAVRLYDSWKEETAMLTAEEKGRLVDYLVEYAVTGQEQEPEGNERFVYPALAARIKRERETSERHKAELAKKTLVDLKEVMRK